VMVNADEIGYLYAGHRWQWRPGIMRHGYELALGVFAQAGVEPNRLCAQAPGVSGRYGTFSATRRCLERADFDQARSFEIAHLVQGGYDPRYEWSLCWSMIRDQDLIAGVLSSESAGTKEIVAEAFRSWALRCRTQYGYCFHQQMRLGPVFHCLGIIFGMRPSSDLTMNTCWWTYKTPDGRRHMDSLLLRDIYPENYLSAPYLIVCLGKSQTTLKEWIEADPPNRGRLEPYTDILTKWVPPVEKIPQVREELYRAGRVFYWQFFCPPPEGGPPDIFYRPDLSAPWEAPDPIPEIYRADYWKDKDPGLTY